MVESNKSKVINLITYPIKGGYGNESKSVILRKEGLKNDRIFCLVDKLTMKKVNIKESIRVYNIKVNEAESKDKNLKVYVFKIPDSNEKDVFNEEQVIIDFTKNYKEIDFVLGQTPKKGIDIEGACIEKINKYLEKNYLLAYCLVPEKITKENYKKFIVNVENVNVNYYDLSPLLIIQQEDVDELNEKLSKNGKQLSEAKAFRPNIIIQGFKSQSVEKASSLIIGDITFKRMSNCGRCKVINFNFEKGEINEDKEPLETLAEYKFDSTNNKTTFGGYFYPESYLKDGKSNYFNSDEEIKIEVGNEVKLEF